MTNEEVPLRVREKRAVRVLETIVRRKENSIVHNNERGCASEMSNNAEN